MTDLDFSQRQARLEQFSEELSTIMTKYGVSLNITGGVYTYSDKELKESLTAGEHIFVYSPDASSGDLATDIGYAE